jgi:hypothetical protein
LAAAAGAPNGLPRVGGGEAAAEAPNGLAAAKGFPAETAGGVDGSIEDPQGGVRWALRLDLEEALCGFGRITLLQLGYVVVFAPSSSASLLLYMYS